MSMQGKLLGLGMKIARKASGKKKKPESKTQIKREGGQKGFPKKKAGPKTQVYNKAIDAKIQKLMDMKRPVNKVTPAQKAKNAAKKKAAMKRNK